MWQRAISPSRASPSGNTDAASTAACAADVPVAGEPAADLEGGGENFRDMLTEVLADFEFTWTERVYVALKAREAAEAAREVAEAKLLAAHAERDGALDAEPLDLTPLSGREDDPARPVGVGRAPARVGRGRVARREARRAHPGGDREGLPLALGVEDLFRMLDPEGVDVIEGRAPALDELLLGGVLEPEPAGGTKPRMSPSPKGKRPCLSLST